MTTQNTFQVSPFSSTIAQWFNEPFTAVPTYARESTREHQPRVDIVHTKTFTRLEFEFPGVPKDKLEVEVKDNVLTVKADRECKELEEGEQVYLSECRKGKFSRQFKLGDHLDTSEVDAQFENGILTLVIKKKEESLAKRIDVK